jgi:hypothetical protein
LTIRLRRRFEDGEFDTRRAKGEGLLGGPPTIRNSPGSAATSSGVCSGRLALLEAREFRLSFGGGMGDGADMAGVEDSQLHVNV